MLRKIHRAFGVSAPVALEFSGWILEGANRQDLPPELLASLVFAESTFRKAAQSPMGAIGPAQVRSDYWQSFCGGNLNDPEQNIYCGAQILGRFRDTCGDVSGVPGYGHFSASVRDHFCALKSYNVGRPNEAARSGTTLACATSTRSRSACRSFRRSTLAFRLRQICASARSSRRETFARFRSSPSCTIHRKCPSHGASHAHGQAGGISAAPDRRVEP